MPNALPPLDSSALANFRELIAIHPALRSVGGPILQYTVVIDANVVIGDLLHKYRNPRVRRTAIEEAIASSVLRVHAPRWLDTEMTTSAIPQVARARGIPEAELVTMWVAYRELLIWDDSLSTPGDSNADGDYKDVPYVVLQDVVAAAGILTKDEDIEQLGGRPLTFEFVLSVREYARATTCCVGLRVGGVMIGYISIAALVEGVRAVVSLVSKLPAWAKISCLVGVLIIVLHPRLRASVLAFLDNAYSTAETVGPELDKLITFMQEKQREADAAREGAALLLRD